MSASFTLTWARIGGVELLKRALSYTLGSLELITRDDLSASTPCDGGDLRALLGHMQDSLETLIEAAANGEVRSAAALGTATSSGGGGDPVVGLIRPLRNHACELLGLWADPDAPPDAVTVADRRLPCPIVATTGALEVAVHGWDVARECGHDLEIPAGLADQLLELARSSSLPRIARGGSIRRCRCRRCPAPMIG